MNLKKTVSLVLALAMVMCCLAGCGKNDEDEIYSYYEVIEGDESSDESENQESQTDSQANGQQTSKNQKTTESGAKDVPSNLKGSTVRILWWQPFMDSEKKVIASFEKQTGMKVESKNATNAGNPYTELIASSLAAKEGYDIVMFNNINFPGRPSSYIQPLNDIKGFDPTDSAWDKSVMDTQKINGKYYGVNINGNNHSEYICMFFNETMFKSRGVKTPRQYWEEGNWNWDTFLECAKAMTYEENGVQKYGYVNRGTAYITYWTMAKGVDFIQFNGNKFVSNLSNSALFDTLKFYNDLSGKYKVMNKEFPYGVTDFRSGNSAMFSCITYAMRKDSSTLFNQMTDKIDAVPFPLPKGSAQFALIDSTLFGVLKGAKNPEGAVHFLRYFLDPVHYDMSSNFINTNLEKTFNQLSKMQKKVSLSQGVVDYAAMVDFANVCHNIALTSSDQVAAKVKSYESQFNVAIQKANKAIGN
ncbi:MAG: extracellular solute-binding protein [Clostridia bacterium]|nr:extracellular solute-binding protein [Clostridia bacterium]